MTAKGVGFIWFYVGIGALALMIGLLTGISASPVVGVIFPLIFSLVSAGGGLYVIRGQTRPGDAPKPGEQESRARLVGKQILAFCAVFPVGLWLGVWAKLNPDAIWLKSGEEKPAFASFTFPDLRLLEAYRLMDKRLMAATLPFQERARIFSELNAARQKRRERLATEIASTHELAGIWSAPQLSQTQELITAVRSVLEELKPAQEKVPEAKLDELWIRLNALEQAGNLDYGKRVEEHLDSLLDRQRMFLEHSLLDREEAKSLEAVLSKTEPEWRPSERLHPIAEFSDPR